MCAFVNLEQRPITFNTVKSVGFIVHTINAPVRTHWKRWRSEVFFLSLKLERVGRDVRCGRKREICGTEGLVKGFTCGGGKTARGRVTDTETGMPAGRCHATANPLFLHSCVLRAEKE